LRRGHYVFRVTIESVDTVLANALEEGERKVLCVGVADGGAKNDQSRRWWEVDQRDIGIYVPLLGEIR
jgi:hypothetical protein